MMGMLAFDPSRGGDKALPGQDELPYDGGEPLESLFQDAQAARTPKPRC
jgi:hypothetical protein